jgi:glutathione S-transferase
LDFRFAQIDWRSDYPTLDKLLERMSQRGSFSETLPAPT